MAKTDLSFTVWFCENNSHATREIHHWLCMCQNWPIQSTTVSLQTQKSLACVQTVPDLQSSNVSDRWFWFICLWTLTCHSDVKDTTATHHLVLQQECASSTLFETASKAVLIKKTSWTHLSLVAFTWRSFVSIDVHDRAHNIPSNTQITKNFVHQSKKIKKQTHWLQCLGTHVSLRAHHLNLKFHQFPKCNKVFHWHNDSKNARHFMQANETAPLTMASQTLWWLQAAFVNFKQKQTCHKWIFTHFIHLKQPLLTQSAARVQKFMAKAWSGSSFSGSWSWGLNDLTKLPQTNEHGTWTQEGPQITINCTHRQMRFLCVLWSMPGCQRWNMPLETTTGSTKPVCTVHDAHSNQRKQNLKFNNLLDWWPDCLLSTQHSHSSHSVHFFLITLCFFQHKCSFNVPNLITAMATIASGVSSVLSKTCTLLDSTSLLSNWQTVVQNKEMNQFPLVESCPMTQKTFWQWTCCHHDCNLDGRGFETWTNSFDDRFTWFL